MVSASRHLAASLLFFLTASATATPCDFKGVSVGDKATPASLMTAFGIKTYKTNPKRWPFEKIMETARKYGSMTAGEMEDWEIGPYCESDSCRIPFGLGVGNNSTPVNVFVSIRKGQITEIDVTFSESNWSEIRPILDKKYGSDWKEEHDPSFVITDMNTKQSNVVERITLTHQTNGNNASTGDSCTLWATNYDMVFKHHDPLGIYHSVFAIKLVSNNF